MSEINMVPFTDVVLVLLVIFMVTTPFLFQGSFQVKLPKVAAPSPALPETITLTVAQGNRFFIDDIETPRDNLGDLLRTMVRRKPGAVVMVNADRDIPHGTVAEVLSIAHQAGVAKVGISVELSGETVPSEASASGR
jgi:biopolymer transport protein ExbD